MRSGINAGRHLSCDRLRDSRRPLGIDTLRFTLYAVVSIRFAMRRMLERRRNGYFKSSKSLLISISKPHNMGDCRQTCTRRIRDRRIGDASRDARNLAEIKKKFCSAGDTPVKSLWRVLAPCWSPWWRASPGLADLARAVGAQSVRLNLPD